MGDEYDYLFKILLVGDSGVGKSCLLTRFTDDTFADDCKATLGVDFKVKFIDMEGKRCKLSIWDTAGQERFRTLTNTYYRGAQGVVFVYDVTRRDTFEALDTVWMKEVELHSNMDGAVSMIVANKVDLAHAREVQPSEGHELAQQHGCLFAETSAKTDLAVTQAFEELLLKVLESPMLLESSGDPQSLQLKLDAPQASNKNGSCLC